MPKLPRYLIRRGKAYYYRRRFGGREIRRSLGTDLREARRKALLMTQQLDFGEPLEPSATLNVAAFGERWLSEYVEQRRSEADHKTASYRLHEYVNPVLGALALEAVGVQHLRALRASLERPREERNPKKLSPQTVHHLLSDVRCLFRYAVDVGALDRSPWRSSVLPRIKQRAPARLSDSDLAAIRGATPERYKAIVDLALYTGLRWGEIRQLQWRHVVMQPSPHLVLENTKSGKVRRVPLGAEALEALGELRQRTSSVFVSDWRPVTARWVTELTREATGVRWHFHQLRHTFACRWLERGGSKETLRRILGHASITTTERYGELSDDAVFREAANVHLG